MVSLNKKTLAFLCDHTSDINVSIYMLNISIYKNVLNVSLYLNVLNVSILSVTKTDGDGGI